jgi:small subunit ribosomal protein S16
VAVKIKLKRLGKIRAPYYRIVVADARTKRDGRAIEEIGKYHPKAEPSFIEVDSERAQHWLSVGAQPTDPVRKLFEITGDWQKFKGLPGAEGTLKTAAAREDKKEIFAAAVKETMTDAADAPKGKGSGRSAGAGRQAAKPAAGGQEAAAEGAAPDGVQAKADKPARSRSGSSRGRGSRRPQAEGGDANAQAEGGDAPAQAEGGDAPAQAEGGDAADSGAPEASGAEPAAGSE